MKIFISYRRADSEAYAHIVKSRLIGQAGFESQTVFLDVTDDGIPVGVDFDDYIRSQIEEATHVLVMINQDWVKHIQERLDEPIDYVRTEVRLALESQKTIVIPVLVEDTTMPSLSDLPTDIQGICKINAAKLRLKDIEYDIYKISNKIRQIETGDFQTEYSSSGIKLKSPQSQLDSSPNSDSKRLPILPLILILALFGFAVFTFTKQQKANKLADQTEISAPKVKTQAKQVLSKLKIILDPVKKIYHLNDLVQIKTEFIDQDGQSIIAPLVRISHTADKPFVKIDGAAALLKGVGQVTLTSCASSKLAKGSSDQICTTTPIVIMDNELPF